MTEQRLEKFAAIYKRSRRWGLVSLIGLAAFLLCVIYSLASSFKGDHPLFVLFVMSCWLSILVGIFAADHVFRCPVCRGNLAGGKGNHCPQCGARALVRMHWWADRACAACGQVLRYSPKGGRRFKIRYCGRCGCHLHEQGV